MNLKQIVHLTHILALLAVFYTTLEITAYYTGNVTCNGTTPIPWYTAAADDLPRGTKVTVLGNTWVVDDCLVVTIKENLTCLCLIMKVACNGEEEKYYVELRHLIN